MKTTATALALLLSLSACGGKPKDDKKPAVETPAEKPAEKPSTPTPPPSAPASTPSSTAAAPAENLFKEVPGVEALLAQGEPLEGAKTFAYLFEKGETASYKLAIRWRLKGVNLPLGDFTGEFVSDFRWEVLDASPDGKANIKVEYKNIVVALDSLLFGGKMRFDSGLPATVETAPLLTPFGKMIGKSFTFTVDKQGTVSALTGQDAILEDALADPAFPAPLRSQIKAAFGEEGLKKLLGQGLLAFPPKAIAKGDSFEATPPALRVPGLGEVNLNEKVTLAGLRKDGDKELGVFSVSVFAILDPKGGPAATAIPGLTLAGEATPTIGEGWFAFDLKRGIPIVAALPVPLDLKLSLLTADGTPTTPEPISVVGEAIFSVYLVE